MGESGLEIPPLLMPVGVCPKSRTRAIIPIVQRRKLRLRQVKSTQLSQLGLAEPGLRFQGQSPFIIPGCFSQKAGLAVIKGKCALCLMFVSVIS